MVIYIGHIQQQDGKKKSNCKLSYIDLENCQILDFGKVWKTENCMHVTETWQKHVSMEKKKTLALIL